MSKIFCTYELSNNNRIFFMEEGQSLPDDWSEYIWQYAKDGDEAVSQHDKKCDQSRAFADVGLPHEESQEIWGNLSAESKEIFNLLAKRDEEEFKVRQVKQKLLSKSVAEGIYEWFQDNFDTFECYPIDWIDYSDTDFTHTDAGDEEVGRLYNWDECWAILNEHYPHVKWRQP